MSWLALLKNQKAPEAYATKATKTPQEDEKGVFVGFVAYPPGHFQEKKGTAEAQPPTPKTTEIPLLGVLGAPLPPVCEKQQGVFVGFVAYPPAHSGKAAPLAIGQKDPANHLPELAQGTAPKAAANDPGHDRLLALAMAFCDHISASAQAREDWQRDVADTPPHLRQGLAAYLREQMRHDHTRKFGEMP